MKNYQYIPRYTYADYAQWEGNWELIYGYPHSMSPSPLKSHQRVGKKLLGKIDELLETETGCKDCELFYELDWIVSKETTVRPDLMIVCGEMKEDFLTFSPTLVIEILSASTTLKDRHIKYELYEAQGVKYYVLINPETKSTEIFELINEKYVSNNSINNFTLHNNCKLSFDICSFVKQLELN